MKKYNIGIDVGFKGAICIISDEGVVMNDMPEKERFYEIANYFIAVPNDDCIVGIEKQNPFPKQGVVSVFSLGWQYGYICALLDYLKMPYKEIRPQEWMAYYGLHGKRQPSGKKLLWSKARKLYPIVNFSGPKGALKDGRVDALLLASYVRSREIL